MNSKKELEKTLSQLQPVDSPKANLEQYPTPANIAAEVVWFAYMQGDIENKIIADLGCGNGILGIACLLLNSKRVFFLDADNQALVNTKQNLERLGLAKFILRREQVSNFKEKTDTIVQNPPFGVQNQHADREFVIKAMESANKIYSFHKLESEKFISALTRDYNFTIEHVLKFKFPLKKTQEFHTKEVHYVDVGCFILQRNI